MRVSNEEPQDSGCVRAQADTGQQVCLVDSSSPYMFVISNGQELHCIRQLLGEYNRQVLDEVNMFA